MFVQTNRRNHHTRTIAVREGIDFFCRGCEIKDIETSVQFFWKICVDEIDNDCFTLFADIDADVWV